MNPERPTRLKVTLHTGAGKTGTSAIQVALAALRPQLAQAGIHYPQGFGNTGLRADRGEISSGNAVGLGWLLDPIERKDGFDRAAILAWLDAAIAEAAGRDLLFSSEIMQRPDAQEAAELCRRRLRRPHHLLCPPRARPSRGGLSPGPQARPDRPARPGQPGAVHRH